MNNNRYIITEVDEKYPDEEDDNNSAPGVTVEDNGNTTYKLDQNVVLKIEYLDGNIPELTLIDDGIHKIDNNTRRRLYLTFKNQGTHRVKITTSEFISINHDEYIITPYSSEIYDIYKPIRRTAKTKLQSTAQTKSLPNGLPQLHPRPYYNDDDDVQPIMIHIMSDDDVIEIIDNVVYHKQINHEFRYVRDIITEFSKDVHADTDIIDIIKSGNLVFDENETTNTIIKCKLYDLYFKDMLFDTLYDMVK